MKKRKLINSFIIVSILFLLCLPLTIVNKQDVDQINYESTADIENNKKNEWIIKWKDQYHSDILDQVSILDWLPTQGIMRVKLNDSINVNEWINQWKDNPEIEYIQPNIAYNISEIPNDRYYDEQYYLQQIKAEKGWEEDYTKEIIIAVLDTGVDINHPDLQGNLINGVNILNKNILPIDDNGHGTNVTGIVAAVSNNSLGISGIARNTKIMPVKVLDQNGKSDSFYVGQGIRYAVDNGADIILLCSGEAIYTPFMTEAVDYAEENGVLVIAATGNKGSELDYPSALPNVLSVGAVDSKDNYVDYSNYGQQIDVVASGEGIFTTNLGGGYVANSGTSMAAPQVAGLAVLLYQKYPDLTPKEIADIIKFSADDVGEPGWDIRTGYGRINFEKALAMDLDKLVDGYELNQTSSWAHSFPLEDIFNAQLQTYSDVDWYWLDLPYDGNLNIDISLEKYLDYGINLEFYTNEQIIAETNQEDMDLLLDLLNKIIDYPEMDEQAEYNEQNYNNEANIEEDIEEDIIPYATYQIRSKKKINMDLPKGKYYIKISFVNEQIDSELKPINYTISNKYVIYKDLYEPNDKPWNAYQINNISNLITGTFDKNYDEDWFKIYVPKNGTLSAEVKVDTKRIDPVIWMQPVGGIGSEIDYNSSGKAEFGYINVSAGEYLIRVTDYNNNIIEDEYQLQLVFKSSDRDSYEPNNFSTQATELQLTNHSIDGVIYDKNDYDWYKFDINNQSYTKFNFTSDKNMNITLYNNNFEVVLSEEVTNWEQIQVFDEGTYYLRLDSNESKTKYNYYFTKIEFVGDFIDIQDHYAREIILEYYDNGLVNGYDDYTFKPDQAINRGEVATFISNILQLEEISEILFTDVVEDEEIYLPILKVSQAGIMSGFEDNTFRPNEIISQEELIVILKNSFNELDSNYIREIASEINIVPYSSISRAEFLLIFDEIYTFYNTIINIGEE